MEAKQQWPRIRDLPEAEREPFVKWLEGQTRPWLDEALTEDQDAYFSHDYEKWKEAGFEYGKRN